MIGVAFLAGGVAGTICAIAAFLLTNLGIGAIIAIYFGIGYGLPLVFLAAAELTRSGGSALPSTDLARH